MSKKQVLNEVRRFMKLANLDANLSSNFVNKLQEMEHSYKRDEDMMEEEEMEMDMEVEEEPAMGGEEMEMDVEMDVDEEEDEAVLTDEEAAILIALGKKLATALETDAEEDIEDAMDDLDDADEMEDEAEEMEDDAAEDLADAAEDIADETLEEILDSILDEDSGAEEGRHYKDDKEADEKHMKALKKDMKYDEDHIDEGEGSKKGEYGREDKDGKVGHRRGVKGGGKYGKGGHYKDYMGEELVQEVLKRVRERLAAMSKE